MGVVAYTYMHEGPGPGFERKLSESEKLLQSWKKGPVILASGSSFKLENLRALGFEHVTSVSAPEAVEEAVFDHVEGRSMHMHEMVAAMVAREKVSYVVDQGAPADALVCGFDTVVMETTGSLDQKSAGICKSLRLESRLQRHWVNILLILWRGRSGKTKLPKT